MSNDPILKALNAKQEENLRRRVSTRLKHVARRVEKELNNILVPGEPEPIFALFVFAAGAAQYVSNGSREDIKNIVASVLRRWDDPAYASLHTPYHEKTPEEFEEEQKDAL